MREQTNRIIDKFFKQAKTGKFYVGEGEDKVRYFLDFVKSQSGLKKKKHILLDIPDSKLFAEKVEKYFLVTKGLYLQEKQKFELTDEAYLERLFVSLMANMTYADAHNVYNYIDQRIALHLGSWAGEEKLGTFVYSKGAQEKKCSAKAEIGRLSSIMEAPYCFTPEFSDCENSFKLPSITFGVIGDRAYVYAVQNRHTDQQNPLQKDLDRYFRKVGKGVEGEEELMQVSPNALVSLTMFVSYLKEKGIKQIVARDFQPARYFSVESRVAEKFEGDVAQNQREVLDKDQFNITNRFMYLFLRYNYHFPACDVDYSIDEGQMIMNLSKASGKGDNILVEIDKTIAENYEKEKQDDLEISEI